VPVSRDQWGNQRGWFLRLFSNSDIQCGRNSIPFGAEAIQNRVDVFVELCCNPAKFVRAFEEAKNMPDVTLEKVLEDARSLPPEEQQQLLEMLSAEAPEIEPAITIEPIITIEQLAAEQGTRPMDFEEMLGDFWPEEENVDDFITTLRAWRSETWQRSLSQ
jgi:hypothetical protein